MFLCPFVEDGWGVVTGEFVLLCICLFVCFMSFSFVCGGDVVVVVVVGDFVVVCCYTFIHFEVINDSVQLESIQPE
jgi:hypothetical protein